MGSSCSAAPRRAATDSGASRSKHPGHISCPRQKSSVHRTDVRTFALSPAAVPLQPVQTPHWVSAIAGPVLLPAAFFLRPSFPFAFSLALCWPRSSSEAMSGAELGFGFDSFQPWGAPWPMTPRDNSFHHHPHLPSLAPEARHLQPLSLPTRLSDLFSAATTASTYWHSTARSQGVGGSTSAGSAATAGCATGAQGAAASEGAIGAGGNTLGAVGPTQKRQWMHQGPLPGGGVGAGVPRAAGASALNFPVESPQALTQESSWQAARQQLVLSAGGEWRQLLGVPAPASALTSPLTSAPAVAGALPVTGAAGRGLPEGGALDGSISEGGALRRISGGVPQRFEPSQAWSGSVRWPAPDPRTQTGQGSHNTSTQAGLGFQDTGRLAAQGFEDRTQLFASQPRQHSLATSFQEVAQAASGAAVENPGPAGATWHSSDWKQLLLETEGPGLSDPQQDCNLYEASAPSAYGTDRTVPGSLPVHRKAPSPENLGGPGHTACGSADPHAWAIPSSTEPSLGVHQGHAGVAHQGVSLQEASHGGVSHQGVSHLSGRASSRALRELQGVVQGMDRKESLGLERAQGESDLLQNTIQAALRQLGERAGEWRKEGAAGEGGSGVGVEGRGEVVAGGGGGGDGQSVNVDTAVVAQGLGSWRDSDAETIADILSELVGQPSGGLTPGATLSAGSGFKDESLGPGSGTGAGAGMAVVHGQGGSACAPVGLAPKEIPVLSGAVQQAGSGRQLMSNGAESWFNRLREGGDFPGYTTGAPGTGPQGQGGGLSGGSSLDLPQQGWEVPLGYTTGAPGTSFQGGGLSGGSSVDLPQQGGGVSVGQASSSPVTSGALLVPLRGATGTEALRTCGGAPLGAPLSPPQISQQHLHPHSRPHQLQHQRQHQHLQQRQQRSLDVVHLLRETSSEKSAWPAQTRQGQEWTQEQGGSGGRGGSAGWSAGHERVKRMRCMSDGGIPVNVESLSSAGLHHATMAQQLTSYSELIRLQNAERRFPHLHALDA